MTRDYKGRVAVITGAANGLGRALAIELAARNCHLALVDIDSSPLVKTKQELSRAGILVTHHCANVASEGSLGRVAGEIERTHGNVNFLINNAGVSASASFLNTSSGEFERIIQVNFFGIVYSCRAFLPLLLGHGNGQILNVSSCFAWVGYPRKTAYASSKAAVRAFSESLRSEVAEQGVGVTVLYPGPLETSLVRSGFSDSVEQLQTERTFLQARGLSLERVARRSLDLLAANPCRIVIGLDYCLLDLLSRLSPRLADRATRIAAQRFGF